MKKVLIITTISGFLPQFEKNNVKLLHEAGCEIHYASNFKNPIYDFNEADLKAQGIRLRQSQGDAGADACFPGKGISAGAGLCEAG